MKRPISAKQFKKTVLTPRRPEGFPENLILIGMFGSGKSTIGRMLANKLRYHFVDVDHLIESKYKMPLQRVLDKLGMKKFMEMEDQTIQALHYRHCVISPGGSAVYYPKSMKHLLDLGPRIFLKVSLPELKKRMPDWSNRGVVCRGGDNLAALFRERAPLFKRYSDLTVETAGRNVGSITSKILKSLAENPKFLKP